MRGKGMGWGLMGGDTVGGKNRSKHKRATHLSTPIISCTLYAAPRCPHPHVSAMRSSFMPPQA